MLVLADRARTLDKLDLYLSTFRTVGRGLYLPISMTAAEMFPGLLPTNSMEQDLISSKVNNLNDPPHPSPVIRLIETTSISIPTILAGPSVETR